MRAVSRADAVPECERLAVGGEPAGAGCRILGEEADQLTARSLRAEVAGAPVGELARVDLEPLHPVRPGDLLRAVAGARVDHEHLLRALAFERREQLVQV